MKPAKSNGMSCNNCGHEFGRRYHLDKHLENKSCKTRNYKCKYCDKMFTTDNSMYRHMKHNCNVKKDDENKRNTIFERLLKLEKENEELKEELKKIKTNTTYNTVNNNNRINNGTINNGTINNIVLIGCGKENMAKIDKEDILKSLKKGFYSTIHLTEAVHFNPKYPEYHNVYISNIRDRYAMMYDGTDWILTRKSELIDRLYEDKKNYIENNMEEFIQSLTTNQTKALERWLNTDDNHERIKEIKDMIKLLLYNKRDQVMERRDQ